MSSFTEQYGTAEARAALEEAKRQENIADIRARAAAGELDRGLNVKEIMDLTGMSFQEAGSLSGAAATGKTRDPRNFNAIALADDPAAALQEATRQMIEGGFFETGQPKRAAVIEPETLVGDIQGGLALVSDKIGGDPYLRLQTITPEGTRLTQAGVTAEGIERTLARFGMGASQEQIDALRRDAEAYYAQSGNDRRGQQLLQALSNLQSIQAPTTGIENLLHQNRMNGLYTDYLQPISQQPVMEPTPAETLMSFSSSDAVNPTLTAGAANAVSANPTLSANIPLTTSYAQNPNIAPGMTSASPQASTAPVVDFLSDYYASLPSINTNFEDYGNNLLDESVFNNIGLNSN